MKRILIFFSAFALLAVLAGCEKGTQRLPDSTLAMSFSDSGFIADDGSAGYAADFSEGDRIGLFAVENGELVETVNNLCLTASATEGGLAWQPSDASMLFPQGAVYYAYYPYQEDFASSVNADEASAEGFFAGLVSSWTLPSDQSGAAFREADLMIGSASVESASIDVAMSHAMALVAIELPVKTYRFTNTDYQIPDYSLSATPGFNDFVPYSHEGRYLYIVKPGAFALSGSMGEEPWTVEGNAAGGTYMLHSEGESEIIEHLLQIGDFFLADGSLISKDAPAEEVQAAHVLGIVCQYNPDRIGEGEKEALGGVAHALVLGSQVAGAAGNPDMYMQYRFYTNYAIQETDWDNCYVRDESEIDFPRVPMESDIAELCRLADADINGYKATHLIYTERAEDFEKGDYPGFKAVYNYAEEVGGPVEGLTTGWFMPSSGQYLDAVRNLCNLTLDASNVSPSGGFDGTMTWFDQGAVATAMNANFEKIAENQRSLYFDGQNGTMVSTEASPECHRYIDLADYGWVDYLCYWKYTTTFVRPMLAF